MIHSNIQYALGTMSGTSMDGIDIALIKSDGEFFVELVDSASYTYQASERFYLKAAEFAIRQQVKYGYHSRDKLIQDTSQHFQVHFENYVKATKQNYPSITWNEIVRLSTKLHAQVLQSLMNKHQALPIAIIGYHGQTLYHQSKEQITVQIGDPAYLSELTGLSVVYDFRQQDVEQGGQGAPLAPIFHQALVVQDKLPLPCGIINCGGIANISLIKGPSVEELRGFDIGPGNVLIDNFVRIKTQYQENFDRDGHYAKQGKVHAEWLIRLHKEACKIQNYEQLPPPKSLDTNDFILPEGFLTLSIQDGCATLATFTAESVAHCFNAMEKEWQPKQVILVGGGWYHPVITQKLRELLSADVRINKAHELNWDNSSVEAQIFSYLAIRKLKGMPFSFPLTTGVRQPLCGGCYLEACHESN